jgi:hypothetical protein
VREELRTSLAIHPSAWCPFWCEELRSRNVINYQTILLIWRYAKLSTFVVIARKRFTNDCNPVAAS